MYFLATGSLQEFDFFEAVPLQPMLEAPTCSIDTMDEIYVIASVHPVFTSLSQGSSYSYKEMLPLKTYPGEDSTGYESNLFWQH